MRIHAWAAPSIGGAVFRTAICITLIGCSKGPQDETPAAEEARPAVSANRRTNPDEHFGWVGLFSPALVAHLENENRLGKLCTDQDSTAVQQCRADALAPDSLVVRLWSEPSATSAPRGALLMIATPGKGLSAFFVPQESAAPVRIEPDLYDQDWGYGPPYFHMSIAEDQRPWVRLPENPFPPNTWLNADDLTLELITEWIAVGNILTSPLGDVYVTRVDSMGLFVRPEQRADMWCSPGEAPALQIVPDVLLPRDSLFSSTGHLRVHMKYTRGC